MKEVVLAPLDEEITMEKILDTIWKSDSMVGPTVRNYTTKDNVLTRRAERLFQEVFKAIEHNDVSQIPEVQDRIHMVNIKPGFRFVPGGIGAGR